MAVQPDKRAPEIIAEERGTNFTVRFRVGAWTLQAMAMHPNPASYVLRHDWPGFPHGLSVYTSPHDGWVIWDGDEKFVSRDSPLECLQWWAGRHS